MHWSRSTSNQKKMYEKHGIAWKFLFCGIRSMSTKIEGVESYGTMLLIHPFVTTNTYDTASHIWFQLVSWIHTGFFVTLWIHQFESHVIYPRTLSWAGLKIPIHRTWLKNCIFSNGAQTSQDQWVLENLPLDSFVQSKVNYGMSIWGWTSEVNRNRV